MAKLKVIRNGKAKADSGTREKTGTQDSPRMLKQVREYTNLRFAEQQERVGQAIMKDRDEIERLIGHSEGIEASDHLRALYATTFLLDWWTDHGNTPVDGSLCNAVITVVQRVADEIAAAAARYRVLQTGGYKLRYQELPKANATS